MACTFLYATHSFPWAYPTPTRVMHRTQGTVPEFSLRKVVDAAVNGPDAAPAVGTEKEPEVAAEQKLRQAPSASVTRTSSNCASTLSMKPNSNSSAKTGTVEMKQKIL